MPANNIQLEDIALLAKRLTIPHSVLIEVCYTCNENCIHCCLDDHSRRGLTLAQYDDLFDQMVHAGTFFVILTGGDPFARDDFMDIVRSARKRRLSVTIFTNATRVNSEQILELRQLCIDEVHVSVYSSDPAIHDGITRVPGSFAKSIATIKQMIEVGITVKMKCPLMNMTADGIVELKLLAKSLGAAIHFSLVITARNDGCIETINCRLTPVQLRSALADPEVSDRSTQQRSFQDNLDCIPCDTVFSGGAIDPDGNVYACNQLRLGGGNIKSQSLGQIWNDSPVFKRLREFRLRDLRNCAACNLFQHCSRCPGLALLEDGDVLGCSSAARVVAEERRRMNIFPTEAHIFSQPIG